MSVAAWESCGRWQILKRLVWVAFEDWTGMMVDSDSDSSDSIGSSDSIISSDSISSSDSYDASSEFISEEGADLIQARLAAGINRSITVVLGQQISARLMEYFSLVEVVLILTALHSVLSVSDPSLGDLKASWVVIKGLIQSLLIQMVVSYLTQGSSPWVTLFNLVVFLVVAECVPAVSGWTDKGEAYNGEGSSCRIVWLNEDRELFFASVSYIFSDEVSSLLTSLGVPLIGASLGLFFGGEGLFGQTLVLTGVNTLCSIAFGVISGGELSVAWPVVLLYFVHEVVGQFDGMQAFIDYGLYKASDSVYNSLMMLQIRTEVIALLFLLLSMSSSLCCLFISPQRSSAIRDELWLGLCVLVVVRAASDWFLDSVSLAIHCDPVIGGLCVVAAIQFATLGVDLITARQSTRR